MAEAERAHAGRCRPASITDAPAAADLRLRPALGLQHPHDAGAARLSMPVAPTGHLHCQPLHACVPAHR